MNAFYLILLTIILSETYADRLEYGKDPGTVERHERSPFMSNYHYYDNDKDGYISCEQECGGKLLVDCNEEPGLTEVYCFIKPKFGNNKCCVSSDCHSKLGVCRVSEGKKETKVAATCPAGLSCYVKSCNGCGGTCKRNGCSKNEVPFTGKVCKCPIGETCCLNNDENSCEENSNCGGKCIDENDDCEAGEHECVDEPCVCGAGKKCCKKECGNPDGCAKDYPGRGICRPSDDDLNEQCRNNEKAISMGPCENNCWCCKRKRSCRKSCHGNCRRKSIGCRGNERRLVDCNCPHDKICCARKRKKQNGESGDPHFTTFDGLSYEFHGPCTYKLFQDCTDKPRFAVHTEHISALGPGHNKTYVYVVWVMLPHTVIELQNTDVKVNGKSVLPMLPITVDTDVEIGLNKPKNKIVVTKPGMFSINWNGNGAIRASLDKAWYGRVCGLLGDGDGESGNDMKMLLSDGTLQLTDDINEFGYSWEVPQSCNKINTAK